LAAAFRWAARLDYHEGIANHFSAAVSEDGQEFLINTRGMHFSRAQASRLALVTTADRASDPVAQNVDATAWILHSFIHRNVPRARCILHTHMTYTTALASLKDFEFLMLDQNACRFYDRIAYDRHYAGMALEPTEGERVASLLKDGKDILFLANHGVLVVADTPLHANSGASIRKLPSYILRP
jgi:ribulose-5-phosphate 4-epimerase/fuculose-1-phosphate aldolase